MTSSKKDKLFKFSLDLKFIFTVIKKGLSFNKSFKYSNIALTEIKKNQNRLF